MKRIIVITGTTSRTNPALVQEFIRAAPLVVLPWRKTTDVAVAVKDAHVRRALQHLFP